MPFTLTRPNARPAVHFRGYEPQECRRTRIPFLCNSICVLYRGQTLHFAKRKGVSAPCDNAETPRPRMQPAIAGSMSNG